MQLNYAPGIWFSPLCSTALFFKSDLNITSLMNKMIDSLNLENYTQLNSMRKKKKKTSLKRSSLKRKREMKYMSRARKGERDEEIKADNLRCVPSFQSRIKPYLCRGRTPLTEAIQRQQVWWWLASLKCPLTFAWRRERGDNGARTY